MVGTSAPTTARDASAPPGDDTSAAFLPHAGSAGHLLDYWHILRLRLGTLIATLVLVETAVALYSFLAVPIYRAECALQIEPSAVRVTELKGAYDPADMARDYQARRDFLQTQIEIIRSERLLSQVFDHFRFEDMAEFRESDDPLTPFAKLFDVAPRLNTYIVDLSFDWHEPRLAAQVTRYLAELYVNDYRERQLGISGRGVAKLREQLGEIREARQDALQTLTDFKRKHRLIDLDDAQRLLVERMSALTKELVEARVEKITAEAAVRSIASWQEQGGDVAQTPEVVDNTSVTTFRLEEVRARAELLELLNKFGRTHPTVQTQEKVVETMREAVEREVRNSIQSARLIHERARLRAQLLTTSVETLEEWTFALDEVSATYRILEDTYKATEDSYRLLINRINEINITQATGEVEAGGNIMVVEQATPPTRPAFPRKKLNLALGGMLGLILGAGLCLFLDYLDSTIKSKDEVEQLVHAPVIGFVPPLTAGDADLAAFRESGCALAEAFRTIRTSLGLCLLGQRCQTFLVTSASPSEGKTLVALNLALALARDGKKVLLLEGDMRRPRLSKVFAKEREGGVETAGLSSVLVGAARLEDAVWPVPAEPKLHVAFCGPIPPNPAELLGTSRLQELLDEARERFDSIILDAPPLLNVADASVLASSGIPVLLVVRVFSTERQSVILSADQLRRVQGQLVGTIVNNADAPQRGHYGYYYGGRYYEYQRYENASKDDATG